MPSDLAADDIILVFLKANGNVTFSETSTSDYTNEAGATSSFSEGISLATFSRKATGSDSRRTFGHSGGSTVEFAMYVVVWRGLDTTSWIEDSDVANYSYSSGAVAMTPPQLTTAGTNRILIYATVGDGNSGIALNPAMMGLMPPPFMNAGSGNNGANCAVGWTVQTASGNSAQPQILRAYRDSCVIAVLALKPADASEAPPHVDPSSLPYTPIALMRSDVSSSPFYNGGAFDPVSDGVTTINGFSTTYDAAQLVNKQGLGGQNDSIGVFCSYGETGMRIAGWGITSVDLSGKQIIVHPAVSAAAPFESQANSGFAIGLRSGSGNYRFFNVGGSDSVPNIREGWLSYLIDVDNAASIQDVGTFNSGAVDGIVVCSNKALVGSNTSVSVSDVYIANRITVVGGHSGDPITVDSFAEAVKANLLNSFPSPSQTLMQIGVGNGSTKSYYKSPNRSLGPFARSNSTNMQNQTAAGYSCAPLFKPSASDTIDLRNSIWPGDGSTPWGFDAASDTDATVLTSGCNVINCVPTLQPFTTAFGGITFTECEEIVHNDADTSVGCTVDGCVGTQAYTITGANQTALQAALDLIANWVFVNSTTYGLKIKHTGTGDVTLTFDGIRVDELLYDSDDAGSTLTAVLSNSAAVTNTNVADDETVTISNDVTCTFEFNVTGVEVTVVQTGTQTVAFTVETSGSSENFVYTAPLGYNVDIFAHKPGYTFDPILNRNLGSSDQTISISMTEMQAYG